GAGHGGSGSCNAVIFRKLQFGKGRGWASARGKSPGLPRLAQGSRGPPPSLRGAKRRSNPFLRPHGLLRGACHRARIRATRWLAMTRGAGMLATAPPKSKGGHKARRFAETSPGHTGCPGGAEAPPGLEGYFEGYFFLAFLAFLAFFAFFAFLAIASSFGLMVKRDTRHARGGLASQQPQLQSNRFAGGCLALSRQCHRVIHSCYAFWR